VGRLERKGKKSGCEATDPGMMSDQRGEKRKSNGPSGFTEKRCAKKMKSAQKEEIIFSVKKKKGAVRTIWALREKEKTTQHKKD